MGNQREIRQIAPTHRLGVAVRSLDDCDSIVSTVMREHKLGHFYTYLAPANETCRIHNMDGNETDLGVLRHPTFIIQSGGKMWCGYDAFRDHIATVAGFLSDATFLVGDENDYIDEYRLFNRSLDCRRVHSGYWMPIDDYIGDHHPQLSATEKNG